MSRYRIPGERDFARAREAMRTRDSGLREVRARTIARFAAHGLHEVFAFYSPRCDVFVVHLFYRLDDQIEEAEKSGLTDRIKEAVVQELVAVGRVRRGDRNVKFEIDSDENVEADFEGDYSLRLR